MWKNNGTYISHQSSPRDFLELWKYNSIYGTFAVHAAIVTLFLSHLLYESLKRADGSSDSETLLLLPAMPLTAPTVNSAVEQQE